MALQIPGDVQLRPPEEDWIRPIVDLPQTIEGMITAELVGAIQTFQTVHNNLLNVDLRVEVGGSTWLLLVELETAPLPRVRSGVVTASAWEAARRLPVSARHGER